MVLKSRYIFIIGMALLTTFFAGCVNRKEDIPDFEVYDEEQFADILFDLTLVEAAYRINRASPDAQLKKNLIYKAVLVNHNTDSLTFDLNWNYYSAETEKMVNVYERVTQKIDEQRSLRGVAVKNEE